MNKEEKKEKSSIKWWHILLIIFFLILIDVLFVGVTLCFLSKILSVKGSRNEMCEDWGGLVFRQEDRIFPEITMFQKKNS